jgi:hypothetical protein
LAQHGRLKIIRINCCPKVSDAAIWPLVEKCPLKEVNFRIFIVGIFSIFQLELIKCSAISANLFANKSFKKCEKLERFSLSGCEAIIKLFGTKYSFKSPFKVNPLWMQSMEPTFGRIFNNWI